MTPQQAAEEAVRAGDPRTALARLTEAVRAQPADARLRTFLAQLLSVLGQWERAHTQLNVVADLDKLAIPMRETVGHAIRCELLRAEVFAGRRTPVVFGQPQAWVAQLIESLRQQGDGQPELAADLAAKASTRPPPAPARSTARPSNGWLTPTPASARCWRPASTATTPGCPSIT